MKFLDRFDNAKKVWELALPVIPIPSKETLIGWLAVYSDEEFEAAVIRTPYRLTQGSMGQGTINRENVYRLVSSLLKNARRKEQTAKGSISEPCDSETSDRQRNAPQSQRKEAECNATV